MLPMVFRYFYQPSLMFYQCKRPDSYLVVRHILHCELLRYYFRKPLSYSWLHSHTINWSIYTGTLCHGPLSCNEIIIMQVTHIHAYMFVHTYIQYIWHNFLDEELIFVSFIIDYWYMQWRIEGGGLLKLHINNFFNMMHKNLPFKLFGRATLKNTYIIRLDPWRKFSLWP